MKLEITNLSNQEIFVTLKPSLDSHKNISSFFKILKGEKSSQEISSGTAELIVYDPNQTLLWEGHVPAFVKNSLIFSGGEISYQGIVIPRKKCKTVNWIWILAVIISIIIIFITYKIVFKR